MRRKKDEKGTCAPHVVGRFGVSNASNIISVLFQNGCKKKRKGGGEKRKKLAHRNQN